MRREVAKAAFVIFLAVSVAFSFGCGGGAGYGGGGPLEPLPAAYVLTPDSGEVVAIDRERLQIISSIPVGSSPTDIVSLRDGFFIYAVSPAAGAISVIDTAHIQVIAEIGGASFGDEIYSTPASDVAYILTSTGGSLIALDAIRHDVITSVWFPSAVGDVKLLRDESRAFCMMPRKGKVAVVDTDHLCLVSTIIADFSADLSTHTPGSDYFYAASLERTYIDVISISRLGVMNRLQLSGLPGSATQADSEGTSLVCLAVPGARLISIFDAAQMRRIADVICSFAPAGLAVAGNGNLLAVAGSGGEVAFLDLLTARFVASPVDVGRGVPLLVPVPDQDLMVAIDQDGKASLLNLTTRRIESTITATVPCGRDAVALDTEYMRLYVGSADKPEVVILDVETFRVIAKIQLEATVTKIVLVP